MSRLVFVDIETTGLDPARHQPWEIALIVREDDRLPDREFCWQVECDLSTADSTGLRVSRFYERRAHDPEPRPAIAAEIATLTANAHLVGAVPSFDAAFLDRFLRQCGAAPAWHYHLIDVEALAVGYLRGMTIGRNLADEPGQTTRWAHPLCVRSLPWDSEELSRALGLTPDSDGRHTALGDARWARDIYDAVHEGTVLAR